MLQHDPDLKLNSILFLYIDNICNPKNKIINHKLKY